MKSVPPLNYVKVRVVPSRPPLIKTRHVASLPSIKVREKQPARTNKDCVEETAAATPPTVYHNDQEEVLFTNDDHFDSLQEIEEEQPSTKKRSLLPGIEKESFDNNTSIAKESEQINHTINHAIPRCLPPIVHVPPPSINTANQSLHPGLTHDLLSTTRLETIVLIKEGQECRRGIRLTKRNGGQFVFIVKVMPQSQADKCGIRAGDIPVYNGTMSSIISSGVRPIPYVIFLQRAKDNSVFTFNVLRRYEFIHPTVYVPKQCTAKKKTGLCPAVVGKGQNYNQATTVSIANQISVSSRTDTNQSSSQNVCPGYPVVGNTESRIGLAEGEHLQCYNKPIVGTSLPTTRCRGHDSGLCYTCYRRSVSDLPVYTIEYQLYRFLLKLRHPVILRRRIDTQLGTIYVDYSYEYEGHLIIIEQDEGDEGLGHNGGGYPVNKELSGLEKRLTAGENGKSTLVIRNSPGDNHFQDPRQVVLIDALINKFKECVDMGHECVRKSMAIFVDSRDKKEYEEHLRTGGKARWITMTNPHLTSARKKFNDVVHSVHSRDPSDTRDGNAKDVPNFVEEALNKIFRD